jgi:predicted molibdopterin-dependent oxidoreductase YjgC
MNKAGKSRSLRVDGALRGPAISLLVDGAIVHAFLGENVATALLASGRRVLRTSPRTGSPRGMFCAMGVCQECVLDIDGRLQTACTTRARDGMAITTTRARDDV